MATGSARCSLIERSLHRRSTSYRGWLQSPRMTEVAETEHTLGVVRGFLDAVARRDVDGVLAQMSEDAVYENFGDDVDAGRHSGHTAIREGVLGRLRGVS